MMTGVLIIRRNLDTDMHMHRGKPCEDPTRRRPRQAKLVQGTKNIFLMCKIRIWTIIFASKVVTGLSRVMHVKHLVWCLTCSNLSVNDGYYYHEARQQNFLDKSLQRISQRPYWSQRGSPSSRYLWCYYSWDNAMRSSNHFLFLLAHRKGMFPACTWCHMTGSYQWNVDRSETSFPVWGCLDRSLCQFFLLYFKL